MTEKHWSLDPDKTPDAPWTTWCSYAHSWTCRMCGAAAGFGVHAPLCKWYELPAEIERPRITHVAIVFEGKQYSLPAPNRHHHIIQLIHEATGKMNIYGNQGFLDASGRFLNRKQALASARLNGQVLDESKVYGGELCSENLW